jgi:2',3'-cyclic-nucleotide 2'-phosphodiesterase (5'-nucleotidase family)
LVGALTMVGAPAELRAQKRVTLVVAATTDVHGRIRGWDYYANAADPARSLAGAATIIDSVRAANPGGVLLLEGGDILQGNPLTFVAARVAPPPVHPVIAAMNVMRYDAAVLGNHEFNYGVPALRKAMSSAGFPFLAANVVDGRGKRFVAPWALVQRLGVKIAIVGGTTPGSNLWDRDHLRAADLTVTDIMPAVRASVAEARKKADVVIVLLHSGLDEPASYDTVATGLPAENVAARVPKEIPGVDVVVFGHSHREVIDTVINGALVMQPRNWAASVALGTLTLAKTKGKWRVVAHKGASVRVAGHAESPAVLAASTTTHRNTVAWVTKPVGRTAVAWRSDSARVVDMPITDLVNEVMRRATGAELSATAAFSLDASLDSGAITQAALSRLYPYDNTLRAVRISGAQLRAFLEHSARYYRTVGPDGRPTAGGGLTDPQVPGFNFDIVSGAEYTIDLTQPVGRRITRLAYRGRAVTPTDSFTMALNNYRQGGGGGYTMLAGAKVVFDQEVDIRQLLIDEVAKAGTLDPARYATVNWTIEPAAARAAALAEVLRGRGAEAGGGAPAAAPAASPPVNGPRRPPVRDGQRVVRVIAMGDFHAQLSARMDGGTPMGGAVALSAAIRAAQRECVSPACEQVVIDAGDLFTGTPASDWDAGRPTVAIMNRLGVAAGALGNHEFDFGQDTLVMRARELRYAILGANVRGPDGRLPTWLRSDTVVVRNGIRIGIVGAAGTHTPGTASVRKVQGLTFVDPVAVFAERTAALRAAGAQVVIAVLHDGGRCERDRPTVCTGGGIDVGRRLALLTEGRPDVYVMGHAHVNIVLDLNGLPAVEMTSSGRGLAIVDLPLGGTAVSHIRDVRGGEVGGADPAIDSIVRRAEARVTAKVNEPVGTVAEALSRSGSQHAMGNLIADAVRVMGQGDVGTWNNGGVRAVFTAGPLNFGAVHAVSPFGNSLVRVRVRGSGLLAAFERMVDGGRPDAHVSGVTIDFDPAKPKGARIVRAVDGAGAPIDPMRTYTIVFNNFMVEDDYRFVQEAAISTEYLPLRDADVFAAYLRRLPQPIRGDATPRIRAIPAGGF